MFCCQCLGEHCAWLFNFVLSVTSTAQCTELLGVSGGNAARIAGVNPLGTQEKHAVPTRRGCVSLSASGPRTSYRTITKIAGLNGPGLWLGLKGHRTSCYLISPYGAAWKLRLTHRQIILKRQQLQPGTNLIFFRAHVNLCCVDFGLESRPMNLPLHIFSKLVRL